MLTMSREDAWLAINPFNSQKWLIWSFSLQYPYITQQKGNENTQTYQLDVDILI